MFALVWWCYPIVMACVAVPMAFFWLIENSRDSREERDVGPYPCLAYMGRDVYMGELWCWLLYGHDGDHEDQFELPDTAFTREWPEECVDVTTYADEEDMILPPLPQRLSKVPEQGTAIQGSGYTPAQLLGQTEEPTLCTWGEDGGGNDSACWKPNGHTGPHMVQDTGPTEHNDPQCSDPRCMLDSGHVGGHDYI